MRFSEYIKDKILICLLHLLCMIFLVDHPWDMDCDRILSQEEIF